MRKGREGEGRGLFVRFFLLFRIIYNLLIHNYLQSKPDPTNSWNRTAYKNKSYTEIRKSQEVLFLSSFFSFFFFLIEALRKKCEKIQRKMATVLCSEMAMFSLGWKGDTLTLTFKRGLQLLGGRCATPLYLV